MTSIALSVVGFIIGVVTGMAAVALATGTGRGWIKRDVFERPIVRTMAALFVLFCGAMMAMFAYDLARWL